MYLSFFEQHIFFLIQNKCSIVYDHLAGHNVFEK